MLNEVFITSLREYRTVAFYGFLMTKLGINKARMILSYTPGNDKLWIYLKTLHKQKGLCYLSHIIYLRFYRATAR